MPFPIEILSLGEDNYASLEVVAKSLNNVQAEFQFNVPPLRLRDLGLPFRREEFHTRDVFEFLLDYRKQAKGHRPFLIAVVNGALRSDSLSNIFGSHRAKTGLAVFTLCDQARYTNSRPAFLCYYFIRYALSFLAPSLKSHPDTRTCFFDKKLNKRDLLKSLETGSLCDPCRSALQSHFNPEVYCAVVGMVDTLRTLVSERPLVGSAPKPELTSPSAPADFTMFLGSGKQLGDGTNIAAGTPFQEEFGTRSLPWYIPADAKAARNWKDNFARLRSRFERTIDEFCPSECFLVQTLIPTYVPATTNPPGSLPDRKLLWAGSGLERAPAELFMHGKPLVGLFPIKSVQEKPILRPDGSPVAYKLGLSRYFSVYAIPDEFRPLPIPHLAELMRDGGNLLYQLPAELALRIWRNWPVGFSQRRNQGQSFWLDALFEMSWQRQRGSPFHTERYAWFQNSSVGLCGSGLFPRLPDFMTLNPGGVIPHENGNPRALYGKLSDVARASVVAIEEILDHETTAENLETKKTTIRNARNTPIGSRKLPSSPVIVLATVNDNETHALLDAFVGAGEAPEQVTKEGVTYNILGTHGDCYIVHTICEMGAGGIGASQQRTRQAIDHWRPKAIIAVGIAFGMDETKQKIGDVLVSTQLQDYELGRLNKNGKLTPRGDRLGAADVLRNRLRQTDTTEIRRAKDWPKIRFGLVLCGQKLADNLDYRKCLKELFPEAIGGEMEGVGLYVSASHAKIDWFVVKAICDWGHNKNHADKDAWQNLAAQNAVRVLKAALNVGPLYVGPTASAGKRRL